MNAFLKLCLIFSAALIVAVVTAQSEDEEEMCLPFRRSAASRHPSPPPASQGRPGKLGPPGPPGPKGDRGIPGTCGCDPSEIERLNERFQQLDDSVSGRIEDLRTKVFTPNYYVENCAVGMKDNRIPNGDITASSEVNSNCRAYYGRLDYVRSGHCYGWAARLGRAGEWLQIDLKSPTMVTGVITQGRGDGDDWITSFKISYGNSISSLRVIQEESGGDKVFQGNQDRNTYVMNRFPQPITARYFRLIAQTWHNHVSLRVEYITC